MPAHDPLMSKKLPLIGPGRPTARPAQLALVAVQHSIRTAAWPMLTTGEAHRDPRPGKTAGTSYFHVR